MSSLEGARTEDLCGPLLSVSLEVCDFEKTELEPSLLGAIYTGCVLNEW